LCCGALRRIQGVWCGARFHAATEPDAVPGRKHFPEPQIELRLKRSADYTDYADFGFVVGEAVVNRRCCYLMALAAARLYRVPEQGREISYLRSDSGPSPFP
jgi:hypothetical protein